MSPVLVHPIRQNNLHNLVHHDILTSLISGNPRDRTTGTATTTSPSNFSPRHRIASASNYMDILIVWQLAHFNLNLGNSLGWWAALLSGQDGGTPKIRVSQLLQDHHILLHSRRNLAYFYQGNQVQGNSFHNSPPPPPPPPAGFAPVSSSSSVDADYSVDLYDINYDQKQGKNDWIKRY